MQDRKAEIERLLMEIDAIELQAPELSRGVVSIKLVDAWKKVGPFVMMLGNFPKLRPYTEAIVAGINRLIEADAENEEGGEG